MQQCNSCGGFNNIQHCTKGCHALICDRCRVNHESVCETNQKKIGLGLGPTVRGSNAGDHSTGLNPPDTTPAPDTSNKYKRLVLDVDLVSDEGTLPTTEQVAAIQAAIKAAEAAGNPLFQGPVILVEGGNEDASSSKPVLQSEQDAQQPSVAEGSTFSPVGDSSTDGSNSGQAEAVGTDASGNNGDGSSTPKPAQEVGEPYLFTPGVTPGTFVETKGDYNVTDGQSEGSSAPQESVEPGSVATT